LSDLTLIGDLSDSDRNRFEAIASQFLAGRAFTRRQTSSTDEDWRFVSRNRGLFAAFFGIVGWGFEIRDDIGAAVVRPKMRRHTQLFSVAQTHLAYQLLLVHLDASESADLEVDEASIEFGELTDRVRASVPPTQNVERTSLLKACRKLAYFGALSLPVGFEGEANAILRIHPVIEMILPPGVVERQVLALNLNTAASVVAEDWVPENRETLFEGDEDEEAEDA
jgi:hypothetical protein